MVFVLPMEETEWNFLSSTTAVSPAFVVSFLTMVTIIAIGPFFMEVPLAFPPVMVSGLSGFFFGDIIHHSFVLRLICVPRSRVGSLAAL